MNNYTVLPLNVIVCYTVSSMRIVIDGRIIASSTGRYIERLLTYLEKLDDKNEYVVLMRSKDVGVWEPSKHNFSVVIADMDDYSLAEQFALKRLLLDLKPDLVHFCMPQQPILYRGKKVTTIHDLFQLRASNPTKNQFIYKFKQFIGWFVFKSIIRSNNHIITDSNYSKREIEQFSKKAVGKTTTIYLSADALSSKKSQPYDLPSKRYILYVGQQSSHKNIRRLIKAHQELIASRPDLWLVLVGTVNPVAQLNKDWVEKNGYKNILFTGFVADEQLAWLYEHALCYGFSSLMEGFGLPGLEAMRHGTPLVSSNTTCSPEIFGNAAIYFDPRSVDDIATKLGQVIDSSKVRAELTKKGYEQVEKYSWEKMARETHAIYEDALKNS